MVHVPTLKWKTTIMDLDIRVMFVVLVALVEVFALFGPSPPLYSLQSLVLPVGERHQLLMTRKVNPWFCAELCVAGTLTRGRWYKSPHCVSAKLIVQVHSDSRELELGVQCRLPPLRPVCFPEMALVFINITLSVPTFPTAIREMSRTLSAILFYGAQDQAVYRLHTSIIHEVMVVGMRPITDRAEMVLPALLPVAGLSPAGYL